MSPRVVVAGGFSTAGRCKALRFEEFGFNRKPLEVFLWQLQPSSQPVANVHCHNGRLDARYQMSNIY
uniref:Uncharacterized protein n=1 Tax=Sphaerodactylus townsendi TaxID=933632 RepID=A0ACB8ESQ8_9SAUR